VKAPKAITHEAGLDCSTGDLDVFIEEAQMLGEAQTPGSKLGPLLFQLPPKLMFEEARAARFFGILRASYSGSVVLEPRHASWFTATADICLEQFHIARAAADPQVVPAALEPAGWGALVYYRLHGSPRRYYSAYGENFLRTLAATLLKKQRNAEVWCIFDNTASGAAMGDALTLQRMLGPHP
jgi:uncharacterized protein YecE (DUF72 family)